MNTTGLSPQDENFRRVDLAVIGGGPAGLAAALEARERGIENILILERADELGGILNQCIHNGFGLHLFKEELTGPEYAERFIRRVLAAAIPTLHEAMVLNLSASEETGCLSLEVISPTTGPFLLSAEAVVLAMGCRERTRGAIGIPGTRPAGVLTAGSAQRYLNCEGVMVGKRVVILGSGDIGLIMARRLTLEGAKVLGVAEVMPYSNGLVRNITQCLDDFDIPLWLSHTVIDIGGANRVESVTIAEVDASRRPVLGTEKRLPCDTLLLAVGLIPENELTRQAQIEIDPRTNGPVVFENRETLLPGVFACGNVLHVHDVVDFVTAESRLAGGAAAESIHRRASGESLPDTPEIELCNGADVAYTVPQRLRMATASKTIGIYFRVKKPFGPSVISARNESGRILTEAKKLKLAPAEMESLTLKKSDLAGVRRITIEVRG